MGDYKDHVISVCWLTILYVESVTGIPSNFFEYYFIIFGIENVICVVRVYL